MLIDTNNFGDVQFVAGQPEEVSGWLGVDVPHVEREGEPQPDAGAPREYRPLETLGELWPRVVQEKRGVLGDREDTVTTPVVRRRVLFGEQRRYSYNTDSQEKCGVLGNS